MVITNYELEITNCSRNPVILSEAKDLSPTIVRNRRGTPRVPSLSLRAKRSNLNVSGRDCFVAIAPRNDNPVILSKAKDLDICSAGILPASPSLRAKRSNLNFRDEIATSLSLLAMTHQKIHLRIVPIKFTLLPKKPFSLSSCLVYI